MVRKFFAASLMVLAVGVVPALAADLLVTVEGVKAGKGAVLLELDNAPPQWDDKGKPLATAAVAPDQGSVSYLFKDLAPGRYAIAVVDDENGNGKLDTNFIGIPTEGFGFSNNLHLQRKPTFEEAAFPVGNQDGSVVIHLDRY